jgi:DNA processing protein
MEMEDELYIMWLSRVPGIGNIKAKLLINEFISAKEVFKATRQQLKAMTFLKENEIMSILANQNKFTLENYKKELIEKNIKFISIYNEKYPKLLKYIHNPPIGIYVLGLLPEDKLKKVSVIGSRRCSEYGMTTALKISKGLAKNNIVIISGMAKGIDSMAHKGAIDGEGYTIAVLGCGVDICYPAENRVLKERILEKGCIISELPPGTKPMPAYFPMRNRIISGLSLAVIVVEATKKSGTLITVEQAQEQGREVMAVPGNITSSLSKGTNELIKDGAVPVLDYTDILQELGIEENRSKLIDNNAVKILAPEEKLVYDCISFEGIAVDTIVNKLNLQVQMVNYILTMLEIKGMVLKLPGQRYIKAL